MKNPKRAQDYFSLLLTLSFVVQLPALVFIMFYHREVVQVVFGGKFLEYSYLLIGVFSFACRERSARTSTRLLR